MPTIPCKIAVPCPSTDNGLGNFSSEAPDLIEFGAIGFPIYTPSDPIGDGPTTGPAPPWYAAGCVGFCLSPISQFAADACAASLAWLCINNKRKPPNTPFFNAAQECSYTCPDGSLYTFTVTPGFVVAASQILADRIAEEIACQRANADHICLGALNPSACNGAAYSSTVVISSSNPPISVAVQAGTLPPGLFLSESSDGTKFTLAGTPSAVGVYVFTLRASDPQGNFTDKVFTITVIGISNSPTAPTLGVPYSFQFVATGGVAPYTFTATGALPAGLTLSTSGLLSGTPLTTGTFNFSVAAQDSNGANCTSPFSMTMQACVDWTKLVWAGPTLVIGNPGGSASGSGSGITANASAKNGTVAGTDSDVKDMTGTMSYTGGICLCSLTFTMSALNLNDLVAHNTQLFGGVEVLQNGLIIAKVNIECDATGVNNNSYTDNSGTHALAAGPFSVTLSFTVAAGINSPLLIQGEHNNQYWVLAHNGFGTSQANMAFNMVIGN